MSEEKELSEAERQAELHWAYVKGVLALYLASESIIQQAAYHYKTAFIHGWKHGQEAMDGKANS